jgi:hypothetical protein
MQIILSDLNNLFKIIVKIIQFIKKRMFCYYIEIGRKKNYEPKSINIQTCCILLMKELYKHNIYIYICSTYIAYS